MSTPARLEVPAVDPADPETSAAGRASWRRLLRLRWGVAAAGILLLIIASAALAPWIAPHDPLALDIRHRLSPPAWMAGGTADHLLGTDQVGRDLLARVIHGGRVSLVVGVAAVLMSATIGVLLGLGAGYFGGNIDWTIMTGINIMLTFPFVLLALAVIAVLGPSLFNMVIVLGVAGWPIYARVIRAETLAIRERDFVVAGRALGMSHGRLIFRQIVPEPHVGHRGDRDAAGGPGDHPGVVPVLPRPAACSHRRRPGATCWARAGSTCSTRGGSPPSRAWPSSSPPW